MKNKIFIVSFPFIDRNATANRRAGVNRWVVKKQNDDLKKKCALYVAKAKIEQKIFTTYYGAILDRVWFFKDAVRRDYDNFCSGAKYYQDAVVKAGIIKDDCSKNLMLGQTLHFDKMQKEELLFRFELFETEEQFNCYRKGVIDGIQWIQLEG